MAWLSATSVRLQQPDARIVVVIEGLSPDGARAVAQRFEQLADDIRVQPSDEPTPVGKSRLHKMKLREYLQGDFVYLDSDTLAVAPLSRIMDATGEVAAAMDFNHSASSTWFPKEFEEAFRDLGWEYPLRRYVNAGVILMRDRPAVYACCEEWVRRFHASSVMPHVWDQATFNSAIAATGVPFSVLEPGYNAMVVKQKVPFKDSRVLHFFGSADEQRGTLMEHLLKHLAETGRFDHDTYARAIRLQHPWGPDPEPWQLVKSHNYVLAGRAKLRALTRRAMRHVAGGGTTDGI